MNVRETYNIYTELLNDSKGVGEWKVGGLPSHLLSIFWQTLTSSIKK